MSANLVKKFKEKNLNSRVRRQDQEAFIEVYQLYVDDLYRFIYFKVGHKEEAQDIASAVFLKAWNYIAEKQLESKSSLKALLYKIARNSIVDHYRQHTNQVSIEKIGDIKDEKDDALQAVADKLEFSQLQAALQELKEEYKEIIVLRHINELSWDEISQTLGKSRGNLRVLLHRATKALQELMDQKK